MTSSIVLNEQETSCFNILAPMVLASSLAPFVTDGELNESELKKAVQIAAGAVSGGSDVVEALAVSGLSVDVTDALAGALTVFMPSSVEPTDAPTPEETRAQVIADAACKFLNENFTTHSQPDGSAYIYGFKLDYFLNLSDYTSNRDAKSRAAKAGKDFSNDKETHLAGDLSTPQQKLVKVFYITKEHCSRVWDAVEANCKKNKVPCTLPWVIADGHTRKYAWLTPLMEKGEDGKTLVRATINGDPAWQLDRPKTVNVLVFSNNIDGNPITDMDYFNFVSAECSTGTSWTNAEQNDVCKKDAGLDDLKSGFCEGSWQMAAEMIGSSLDAIRKVYANEFRLLDNLRLTYHAPQKTLNRQTKPLEAARFRAGVRAAILKSFDIVNEEYPNEITTSDIIDGFWKEFYSPWLKGEGMEQRASNEDGEVGLLIRWIVAGDKRKDPDDRTGKKMVKGTGTQFSRKFYNKAQTHIRAWCKEFVASKK